MSEPINTKGVRTAIHEFTFGVSANVVLALCDEIDALRAQIAASARDLDVFEIMERGQRKRAKTAARRAELAEKALAEAREIQVVTNRGNTALIAQLAASEAKVEQLIEQLHAALEDYGNAMTQFRASEAARDVMRGAIATYLQATPGGIAGAVVLLDTALAADAKLRQP